MRRNFTKTNVIAAAAGALIALAAPMWLVATLAFCLLIGAVVLGVRRREGHEDTLRPVPAVVAGVTLLVVGLITQVGLMLGIGVALGLVALTLLLAGGFG